MNEHFSNLVFFLLWAERDDPNSRYGGVKIADAIDSLAAIINVPASELRKLIDG
jgi:hypothetical protein